MADSPEVNEAIRQAELLLSGGKVIASPRESADEVAQRARTLTARITQQLPEVAARAARSAYLLQVRVGAVVDAVQSDLNKNPLQRNIIGGAVGTLLGAGLWSIRKKIL